MSALAYWYPPFGELGYLPVLCFPFVKMYGDDAFASFEIIMTVLVNWCQDWWHTFPEPPIRVLSVVDGLLHQHDPELFRHLRASGADATSYCWIPLQSLFSNCLARKDWSRLCDNCFTRQPRFLYHFLVAYLMALREWLFQLETKGDIEIFLHQQQNGLDMKSVLRHAADLNTMPYGSTNDVFAHFRPFRPLPRPGEGDPDADQGRYPSLLRLSMRDVDVDEEAEVHAASFGEVDILMEQRLASLHLQ